MAANMRIDQAGLPAGDAGFARTDGLDTGALVTLTSVDHAAGQTSRFQLLWVPPGDQTALPSLTRTGAATFTFTPATGPDSWGSYRIELITDEGLPSESRQIREFSIRTTNGIYIPSANGIADPRANRATDTAPMIARSEQNEPWDVFTAGSPWGWFRAWQELSLAVETLLAGGGGGGITELTGDVIAGPGSGSEASLIASIQGNTVDALTPTTGDVLTFDGSAWVPSPGGGGGGALLYEMPISTSAFGLTGIDCALLRDGSDSGTPSGTPSITLIDVPWFGAASGVQAVKVGCTTGRALFRLLHGITLPAEGYIVDIEIAQYDASTWYGYVMPMGDFSDNGGTTIAEGIVLRSYQGASNIDTYVAGLGTGPYAFVSSFTPSVGGPGWAGAAPGDGTRGPLRMIVEVRRVASRTPADWQMRVTAYPANAEVYTATMSGVGNALTALDGNPFQDIGFGCEGGVSSIAISGLRIFSLDR